MLGTEKGELWFSEKAIRRIIIRLYSISKGLRAEINNDRGLDFLV